MFTVTIRNVFIAALFPVLAVRGSAQAPAIVSNPAPNPNSPAFRISAQPMLKLGGLNNDTRYEFIGISQVDITETGRLIVLPSGGPEVRVFDLRGQYQRTLGRRGSGPGEFTQVAQISALRGDTIAVYDNPQRRVTILNAATGDVIRTVPDAANALCCFLDASFLARPNYVRPSVTVTASAPDTSVWDVMGLGAGAPPRPRILTTRGNDPEIRLGQFEEAASRPGERSFTLPAHLPPFARTATVVVAGNNIVYGVSERFEFNVYSNFGANLRTVRAAAAPVTPSRADIDAARKEFMSGADTPEKLKAYEEHYSKIKLYTTLPAFGRILAESDGTVWVQNYMRPGATAQWWTRFDPSGKMLGTINIPPGMNVRRFARGYVLFVPNERPDGVATLFVHRIERMN